MNDIEELLRESLRQHAGDAPPPTRVISSLLQPRTAWTHRRRPIALGIAATSAAAVAAVAIGLNVNSEDPARGVADSPSNSTRDASTGIPTAATTAPTTAPPSSTSAPSSSQPTTLVVPSQRDLTQRLSEALPAPSTRNDTLGPGTQQDIAATTTRIMGAGEVSIAITNLTFKQSDAAKQCDTVGNDGGRGMNCVATDTGWITTEEDGSIDAVNASHRSRTNHVWFVGHDGAQVHIWATNYTTDDASDPTTDAPVLTVEQLTALATQINWYGTR